MASLTTSVAVGMRTPASIVPLAHDRRTFSWYRSADTLRKQEFRHGGRDDLNLLEGFGIRSRTLMFFTSRWSRWT